MEKSWLSAITGTSCSPAKANSSAKLNTKWIMIKNNRLILKYNLQKKLKRPRERRDQKIIKSLEITIRFSEKLLDSHHLGKEDNQFNFTVTHPA